MRISDFFHCDDEQFLENCYQFILGRDPDENGFAHHLNRLQNGLPRPYLIFGMTRSREGRRRNVKIAGLWTALFWAYVNRLPLLRDVAAHIAWAQTSDGVLSRVRAMEYTLGQMLDQAEKDYALVPSRYINLKHDEVNLQNLSPRAKEIFHELVG